MTRQLLLVMALAFVAYGAKAQNPLEDYVLETRGDTLVIADFFDAGVASTLGAVIDADTQQGNVPDGRVYMLHAGANGDLASGNMALYLQDAPITEQGRPLTIVGEYCAIMVQGDDPDCRPPTISGYQNAANDPILASIAIDDDLTMKNLHYTSAHTQGQADWSGVNVNGNNLTVTWENVLMEHNRWTWINSNDNPGTSLVVKDSYFLNATDQPSRRNGGVYDAVGVPTESIWVENSTHLENQGMQYKFRSYSPSQVIFNHNTFVNAAGQVFLGFGYLTNFAATNNLFVNSNYLPYYPGLDQAEFSPDDTDFQPHGIINLAPLATDDAGNPVIISSASFPDTESFAEADRQVLVDLNAAYWADELLDIAADLNAAGVEGDVCEGDGCVQGNASLDWSSQAILANERTVGMFEDDATWPLLTWGTWYQDGAPGFVDGPDMVQALYDWGYDSANSGITVGDLLPKVRSEGNEVGNEIDGEDTNLWIVFDWPVAVDLAYTNQTYLDGGYSGYPIGDLNWFPAEKESWLDQRDAEYAAIENCLSTGCALTTAIEEVGGAVPREINLQQNYPNPFSRGQATQIAFSVPQAGDVELKVYDILGRRVATLVNERLAVGNYSADWSGQDEAGRDVSSGVYFYTLRVGDRTETKQMVFVK
jgi:hypothetical protein